MSIWVLAVFALAVHTVFTWLNVAAFIILVPKIDAVTIKIDHHSLLTNYIYVLIFTIDCEFTGVQRLLKVWHLTK